MALALHHDQTLQILLEVDHPHGSLVLDLCTRSQPLALYREYRLRRLVVPQPQRLLRQLAGASVGRRAHSVFILQKEGKLLKLLLVTGLRLCLNFILSIWPDPNA